MKRSLITWDETELPRATFTTRLERVRKRARDAGVPAIVSFTDVWRSNHGRHLVNFMPFWGSSLVVVPVEGEPVLICGNSPRVYPWIRTVTIVDDIRPAKNLAARFLELAAERGWSRVGVIELLDLPFDVYRELRDSDVDAVALDAATIVGTPDERELAMHRTAAESTRRLVAQAVDGSRDLPEHQLVARLERALRGAGMEDVLVRISNGDSAPRPASAKQMTERSSVAVAAEYRGHWAFVSRPVSAHAELEESFQDALTDLDSLQGDRFDLSGPFPFQGPAPSPSPGTLIAVHLRSAHGLYYGDTCIRQSDGGALLL